MEKQGLAGAAATNGARLDSPSIPRRRGASADLRPPVSVAVTPISTEDAATAPRGELGHLLDELLGGAEGSPRDVAALHALGGLRGLARTDTTTLVAAGMTRRRAERLVAAVELGRRILEAGADAEQVGSFDAVVRWARPRLAHLDHEEVWLLLLDGRNRLRAATRVAQGGLHACALTPADVLRPAIRGAASAVVLIHNHPSGDPSPSQEDRTMTRAVATACDLVAVPLLDHVIVARDGATSLFECGVLGAHTGSRPA